MGRIVDSATPASAGLMSSSSTAQPSSITSDATQLDDAGPDEGAHLLDVVGQPRQQLAGLRLIVVAEAEPLDAREQPLAQIEGDALRRALGEVALQEVEEAPPDRDGRPGRRPRSAPSASARAAAAEAVVDGQAHHLRRGQVGRRDAQKGEQRADGLAAIAAQVAERPAKPRARCRRAAPARVLVAWAKTIVDRSVRVRIFARRRPTL